MQTKSANNSEEILKWGKSASDFSQILSICLLSKLVFMKIIVTVLPLMLLTFYGYSQKLNATKVPQAVKSAFQKAHPNAVATWEWEDANYEANFTKAGKTMSCVIDKAGTILETESPVTAAELPAVARTYVNEHYKGKKWKEVAKIVKANGEVNYEVNVGKDVLFDANGNHLVKKEND